MCGLASLVLIALALFRMGHSQLLDDECGGLQQITYRIRAGSTAPIQRASFMASLYNETGYFYCGGSLVHKRYVLTAGHCVEEGEKVILRLGEHDRSCAQAECPHVQQFTAEVIMHPAYDRQHNDIALLRLDRPVNYTENIKPICIILDEDVRSDAVFTFSAFGWGKTDHSTTTQVLKTVDLNRLDTNQCYIGAHKICAGSDLGDTCAGDSGGPLAANTSYRGKDLFVQYGITSYGAHDCKGNGVYTDVTAYRMWMANVVLETQPRLLTENCRSDWGGQVLVRLWELSLFRHSFSGALIANRFVLTVASAFPASVSQIKVESIYSGTYDVAWFEIHPEYTSSLMQNNIAVIKLARKLPPSVKDLETPICMGLKLSAPRIWTAYLYSLNSSVLGVQSVDLQEVDNCSARTKLPVGPDQFCLEKPNQLMFAPYETPGSVIGTKQTFRGTEKYLIAGLISYSQDDVIVLTSIQHHEKWITDMLKK
ncbi:transmembrane protease serine 12 [Drosophila biarmipes]|uniref:transmembrane protease serine 12 n=1 Tax=Drosophila biarmipes TaxID=125945 RepID=UPI0007E71DBF|nr:transmembrane protease serine 12 [Drosophila biarmipes]